MKYHCPSCGANLNNWEIVRHKEKAVDSIYGPVVRTIERCHCGGEVDRILSCPNIAVERRGPIRTKDDIVFDRPNTVKEMEFTFRTMEERGKFRNNPQLMKTASTCLAQAKSKPQEKVDYGKGDNLND